MAGKSRSTAELLLVLPAGTPIPSLAVRYTYILIGLTPSERALLEKLVSFDQGHGDELVPVQELAQAQLIVANGDDGAFIDGLRQAHPQALLVLVGQPPGQTVTNLPVLTRPLDLHAVAEVMSRLDWPLVWRGTAYDERASGFQPSLATFGGPPDTDTPPAADAAAYAATTASLPLPAPAAAALLADTAPAGRRAVSSRASWASSAPMPAAPPPLPEPPGGPDDVLVVAGALGERVLTLPHGLRHLGFRVRVVEGADAAPAVLAQSDARFVFLDQLSLGDRLLPLVRTLVAQRPASGQASHVIVVARRGTVFERLRASLMGCVWMTVPIDRQRLVAFFARRGLQPRL